MYQCGGSDTSPLKAAPYSFLITRLKISAVESSLLGRRCGEALGHVTQEPEWVIYSQRVTVKWKVAPIA